jgi:hypothetical protein
MSDTRAVTREQLEALRVPDRASWQWLLTAAQIDAIFAALPAPDYRCGYGCSLPTDHAGPHLLPTHTLPNEAAQHIYDIDHMSEEDD